MLVVTRRVGESLLVGNRFVVCLQEITSNPEGCVVLVSPLSETDRDSVEKWMRSNFEPSHSISPVDQDEAFVQCSYFLELGQRIELDADVALQLVDILPNKARFGFEGPPYLGIYRKEVFDESE